MIEIDFCESKNIPQRKNGAGKKTLRKNTSIYLDAEEFNQSVDTNKGNSKKLSSDALLALPSSNNSLINNVKKLIYYKDKYESSDCCSSFAGYTSD